MKPVLKLRGPVPNSEKSIASGTGGRTRRWQRPARRTVAAGLLATVFAVLVLTGLTQVRVETGLNSFLPAEDPVSLQFDEMSGKFGGDPVVVLLEGERPRALLDGSHAEAVVRMEGQLAALPDVAAVHGPGTMLNQIAAQTQNLLSELMGRRDALSAKAEAEARGRGESDFEARAAGDRARADFDVRYGPMLVQGLPAGAPTLRNAAFVNKVVFSEDGPPRGQWRFVVPSENSLAILVRPREGADAAATAKLVDNVRKTVDGAGLRDAKATVSGVPTVVASLSERTRTEGPVLAGLAVLSVGACYWFVPWIRRRRRLIPLAATLGSIAATVALFGWLGKPLSLGVIAFLSVVLGIGSYYPTYFAMGARPRTVLTVACGTALSFATLMLSPLPLVQDLGLTLSLGVLMAALTGLVTRKALGISSKESPERAAAGSQSTKLRPAGRRVAALIGAAGIAAVGWAQLPGLPLDSNVNRFASGLPALDDAQHVQSVIGSAGEVDVMLTGVDVLTPEAVEWMNRAQQSIVTQYGDELRPAVSPPTLLSFLGKSADPQQIEAAARLLPPYLTGSVLTTDRSTAVMRFGVELNDLSRLQEVRDHLVQALPPAPPGYQVVPTGLPVVAAQSEKLISEDRVLSNVAGIAAAGLVLGLGLRRRSDAARAVLSAAVATGIGLFALWLTGIPLTPITVALGSLTAAVGCEFTVLLATGVRSGRRALGRAVLLVAATSMLGYLVLVASGLAVVREFGALLTGAVALALISSWLVVRVTVAPEARTAPQRPLVAEQPKLGVK